MSEMNPSALAGPVVEEELRLTLVELCRISHAPEEQIRSWVGEGVLEASGESPQQWRFAGASLRRARVAARLTRDLELNTQGVALALDLLDEIESLRAQLRRLAGGGRR